MANMLLRAQERNLTPEEVERLDRRRRRGQLYLVLCLQCLVVATMVSLWTGQDLTYSPGWIHPVAYWNAATLLLAAFFAIRGLALRRGSTEFISY